MKTQFAQVCSMSLQLASHLLVAIAVSVLASSCSDTPELEGYDPSPDEIPFADMTSYGSPQAAIRYSIGADGVLKRNIGGYVFEYSNGHSKMSGFTSLRVDQDGAYLIPKGYSFTYDDQGRMTSKGLRQFSTNTLSYAIYNARLWQYDSLGTLTKDWTINGRSPSILDLKIIHMDNCKIYRNVKGQVLKREHYTNRGSGNMYWLDTYEIYIYKSGIIDSIVTYDAEINLQQSKGTIIKVISQIKHFEHYDDKNVDSLILGSHTLWQYCSLYQIHKSYNAKGKPLLTTTLNDEGDSINTIRWNYDDHIVTEIALSSKTTKAYDAEGRLVKTSKFNRQRNDWVLAWQEQRIFINHTIKSVIYSNQHGPVEIYEFLPYAIDLYAGVEREEGSHSTKGGVASLGQ